MLQGKILHSSYAGRDGRNPLLRAMLVLLFLVSVCGAVVPVAGAAADQKPLAATPPMGWNDWAHYQCGYTADTILDSARALVSTGLARLGYDTVTIDDCWMQKDRDAKGDLQVDPKRFPNGMKPVADAVHKMGLQFGIYEDSGSGTCGRFAGSGQPQGGGQAHFLADARLFASWGVDYLKLDGCNFYVPPGESEEQAYHMAYAAQHAALEQVDRPIVFSESAPAYFQGTPEWYDVLSWVGKYGQLWREGSDIATYHAHPIPAQFRRRFPQRTRYQSMLWNYSYNLPLGRFQKPGNWNDADFIIAGDIGMSVPESRTQMALWSMMSAPLILSSDVAKLSPAAIAIVGNKDLIAIDQDPLGKMATLVRRTPQMDVLFKRLSDGDDAVAAMNHGDAAVKVDVAPAELGFEAASGCTFDAKDLWSGKEQSAAASLQAEVASHDAIIWRIHPSTECGTPARTGTVTMITAARRHGSIEGYARCLGAAGSVEPCTGDAAETWTVTKEGALRSSGGECLAVVNGKPVMQACHPVSAQQWRYTLKGNLVNDGNLQCLTAAGPESGPQSLQVQVCGHNMATQIWSLPN
ncbi:MAG TPA: ricin-type beta-trefoil lectin domain protein [Terriglobia bacterium]|nr:ricin-type beta-trefoil lectin domain protein [Terriglobia bacterium]